VSTVSDSLAQGSFLFANHVIGEGVNAPVFDSSGNPLEGPRYRSAMYVGVAQDSLLFAASTPFLSGPEAGYFDGGLVINNTVSGGVLTWVRVAAWDATVSQTFEGAQALGMGGYGESAIFSVLTGRPFAAPPTLPGFFENMQSFSLSPVVPEPSSFWILAVSLPLLWLVRRRNS